MAAILFNNSEKQQERHQHYALLAICVGNPQVTDEFPSQIASIAESVSM